MVLHVLYNNYFNSVKFMIHCIAKKVDNVCIYSTVLNNF